MKKATLAVILSLAALATSALATNTFTWTPTSQTVAAGGTFNVTLSLQVTSSPPTQVVGYDYILEAANPQGGNNISGLFAVTAASSNQASWTTRSGVPSFPETLTTGSSDHTGFVQNPTNLGFNGDPVAASAFSSAASIETLTLSVAANTPAGTYTFQNTGDYTSNVTSTASSRFSDISDGSTVYHMAPATFSITVVPEPATWSLMGIGGLGSFGLTVLRARRKNS